MADASAIMWFWNQSIKKAESESEYALYNDTTEYRLGSRFCVNENSQISERYSVQMKAAT